MAVILPCLDKFPQFGANCFVAPNATIIGDVIMGDECSIWFNAVVRGDRCLVQSNSIIAAGAVVLEDTVVEAGSIYAGIPAKKVKDISKDSLHSEIERIANNYIKYASWFSEFNAAK